MAKTSQRITAAEYIRQTTNDPEHQARMREHERHIQEIQRLTLEEQEPIVRDLRAAGVRLNMLWDLVQAKYPYPEAIPVLVKHVSKPYSHRTLDAVVRSLVVPEARGLAWDVLRDVLLARKSELSESAPYALGTVCYALGVLTMPKDIPAMLEILKQDGIGNFRNAILENTHKLICSPALLEQAHAFEPDAEIAKAYGKFLRRLSTTKARS